MWTSYARACWSLAAFLVAFGLTIPAFSPRELRVARPLLLTAPALFLGGVAFCYLVVLPPALGFLLGFNESQFDTQLRASDYYDFTVLTMLALGLGFQVPVCVRALTRLGWRVRATRRGTESICISY